jgi:uncharacterized protein (DUF1810 family)
VSGPDPFNLQRFVDAQDGGVYEQALAELTQGRKQSHWMWFIFPQHVSLGHSQMAKYYGLSGVDEARAYLGHAPLGERLLTCCDAVILHLRDGMTASQILGDIDALKIRSSMEIFDQADPAERRFSDLLQLLETGEG